jgi:hypothetical protein
VPRIAADNQSAWDEINRHYEALGVEGKWVNQTCLYEQFLHDNGLLANYAAFLRRVVESERQCKES